MITRKSTAIWDGGVRGGKGSCKCDSGSASVPFSHGSRYASAMGSNPEELLAAAQASCFVMTLCEVLEKAGCSPTRLEAHAACTLDKLSDCHRISSIKLIVRGSVPNLDPVSFQRIVQEARDNCPVAQALRGSVRIELDCRLD
jgi:lipoyl-dependent peroxiredoxin